MKSAMEQFYLSAQACTRILKVARTIADPAGSEDIEAPRVAEAMPSRRLDRGTA